MASVQHSKSTKAQQNTCFPVWIFISGVVCAPSAESTARIHFESLATNLSGILEQIISFEGSKVTSLISVPAEIDHTLWYQSAGNNGSHPRHACCHSQTGQSRTWVHKPLRSISYIPHSTQLLIPNSPRHMQMHIIARGNRSIISQHMMSSQNITYHITSRDTAPMPI